jgi:hypothetical protein
MDTLSLRWKGTHTAVPYRVLRKKCPDDAAGRRYLDEHHRCSDYPEMTPVHDDTLDQDPNDCREHHLVAYLAGV